MITIRLHSVLILLRNRKYIFSQSILHSLYIYRNYFILLDPTNHRYCKWYRLSAVKQKEEAERKGKG